MELDSAPLLSFIVTYNSAEEIRCCLHSVRNAVRDCEVFVVDNAPADSTPMALKDYAQQWPALHLILNTQNKGLAYANNQPMELCKGRNIVILDPDTVVSGEAFRGMAEYLERHPEVGVVGPLSVYADAPPPSAIAGAGVYGK